MASPYTTIPLAVSSEPPITALYSQARVHLGTFVSYLTPFSTNQPRLLWKASCLEAELPVVLTPTVITFPVEMPIHLECLNRGRISFKSLMAM